MGIHLGVWVSLLSHCNLRVKRQQGDGCRFCRVEVGRVCLFGGEWRLSLGRGTVSPRFTRGLAVRMGSREGAEVGRGSGFRNLAWRILRECG